MRLQSIGDRRGPDIWGHWLDLSAFATGMMVQAATVRSMDGEADGPSGHSPRTAADDTGLQLVATDLTSGDDGWPAVKLSGNGCEVHCTSLRRSRVHPAHGTPTNRIVPAARQGTVRGAEGRARDAGARRVVLTSSFAAVGYSPKEVRDYTEADWTDPDTPGLPPYPRSKAIAERAAWDFIGAEGGDTQLVVVNPTFIAGPSLVPALRSTLTAFKAIIEGTMPALPRQRFGVVDVRRRRRRAHHCDGPPPPPPGSVSCR